MDSKKILSVSNTIKKRLETIPGIVDFVSLVEDNNDSDLNWIHIDTDDDSNLEISIAIIINRNVATINLSKEVYEAIHFEFKKLKFNLKKLNFYIRGVK